MVTQIHSTSSIHRDPHSTPKKVRWGDIKVTEIPCDNFIFENEVDSYKKIQDLMRKSHNLFIKAIRSESNKIKVDSENRIAAIKSLQEAAAITDKICNGTEKEPSPRMQQSRIAIHVLLAASCKNVHSRGYCEQIAILNSLCDSYLVIQKDFKQAHPRFFSDAKKTYIKERDK